MFDVLSVSQQPSKWNRKRKESDMPKVMRVHYFLVSGCGSFPFELLAEEKAWPASIADAKRIELACPTQAPEVSITFAKHGPPLMLAQWRKKGWSVKWESSY